MKKIITYSVVIGLLALMSILAVTSMWGDAAIMDEGPHISAGYSYLRYLDMRINPEHPPLVKDLAGLPLQFLKLNFKIDHPSWKTNINDQWVTGPVFFYESGNNPDKIIRVARLGVIWLLPLLGYFIFRFAKRAYGTNTALLSVFLFAFSPTFLAHGRYVTTDVGAALGFFIGIFCFLEYLWARNSKTLIASGIALGVALVLKFSTFLLVPFLAVLAITAALANYQPKPDGVARWSYWQNSRRLALGLLVIYAVAGILIWLVYIPHVWHYPQERQYQDSAFILSSFGSQMLVDLQLKMSQTPILRPIAQYLLGLFMVVQRAAGGNTTYFLGDISATGWWYYFPVVFAIKEHLTLLILIILAIFIAIRRPPTKGTFVETKVPFVGALLLIKQLWLKIKNKGLKIKLWLSNYPNFVTFSLLLFIIIYWLNSMTSNLNIGVRHVLPTLPFIYLLISKQIISWLRPNTKGPFVLQRDPLYFIYFKNVLKGGLLTLLLVWYFLSAIFTYPHYLAYFNELVYGSKNGYKYVVDSNLDWGQDLKRLAKFVEENKIEHIKLDYFGSGSPRYYLGKKFEPWNSSLGPTKGWIAVSATFLMGSVGQPTKGFQKDPRDDYSWLFANKPFAQIGNSIFVYHLR